MTEEQKTKKGRVRYRFIRNASISVRWKQRRRRHWKKSYPSSGWATGLR